MPWGEFQALTPALYARIWREYRVTLNLQDQRAGLITAAIYNVNRGSDTEPVQAHDFYPALKPPEQRTPRNRKEAKDLAQRKASEMLARMKATFGG